uniref:Truncated granule-bound starch synthase n=1 Tax=Oryza sativa subsp. japonica TaxID=39947 RepID=C7B706_ORYSJ|nr:truncated granule-bound starch synthase [Oryza sativa Japonica Group]ACT52667.1 truncated granule-bound starch synthase [Oryza sativa Japonica Group]ACT52670.1 truncated granule-bound starch synthase [Oryza sativa Japonica Group]ACT65815.1 truncated granule-bound starch synthase [Oryza sativa Japonica Group]ACU82443.1 truncated granule-bound starch synthase [Oryza sativa Japonica Group]
MSALTTSQLATSATGFGIADRSAPSSLLRHGFQGLKPTGSRASSPAAPPAATRRRSA